jgi:hypothetical protein
LARTVSFTVQSIGDRASDGLRQLAGGRAERAAELLEAVARVAREDLVEHHLARARRGIDERHSTLIPRDAFRRRSMFNIIEIATAGSSIS